MKILIDINHPAHVHYFRHFIKIMENKGHSVIVISRNKEIEHYLLEKYKISFDSRGKGGKTILKKIIYFFYATIYYIIKIKSNKPDIVISFGTPYPAIASKCSRTHHISINDTEHAKLHHLLTDRFSEKIITPFCYYKDLGKKHIRFNGFMEQCYLDEKYFSPDISILDLVNVQPDEKYIIVRFVSWNSIHDKGERGFTLENKKRLIMELSKYARVMISSESELPIDLLKYQVAIPPEKMHDLLSFSALYIGEGATMASESAILGCPAIYVNSLRTGYIEYQIKSGLTFQLNNIDDIINKARIILLSNNKEEYKRKRDKMLKDKINVTEYFVNFFENYFNKINNNLKNI